MDSYKDNFNFAKKSLKVLLHKEAEGKFSPNIIKLISMVITVDVRSLEVENQTCPKSGRSGIQISDHFKVSKNRTLS